MAKEFNTQYRGYMNISTVRITTPTPLSEAMVETIRKILDDGIATGKLEMETRTDSSW
ncbi:MAG: hypothetical protein IPH04_09720 [Saprospirales bacterium]|nr:hypothetical protein [Saprospirales bacterium]